jgi:hypothetical protein
MGMSKLVYVANKVLGTGLMLAMLLTTFAAFAQEEVEDIGPAVDTSTIEESEVDAGLPEEIEPAVDTSAPGNAITRSTTGNRVMDSIELGRTEITGNQELPTVMYIVPWKKADPGDLMGKPVNTLLDEVLAPIDREEFVRQVDYYQDLYGEVEQE